MFSTTLRRLALGAVGALACASVARAQSPPGEFCRHYADDAVREARVAHDHGRCFRFIQDNPARWSMNGRQHFDWCMANGGHGTREESRARHYAIERCRPDWHG